MKYLKMLVLMIALSCFILIGIYHFLPVSYDAGACGGGFNSYIYNKNIEKLTELYLKNNNIDNAYASNDYYTVGYQGRDLYITTTLSYEDNGETIEEEAYFKGKRIWTEIYIWEQIKSEL